MSTIVVGLRRRRGPAGEAEARTRPKGVDADAADDAKAIREGLRRRGIRAGIPKNPRRGKGTRGGKRAFRRRKAYRRARSSVERFFGWLKGEFRRLTVRHERRLSTFLAFVQGFPVFHGCGPMSKIKPRSALALRALKPSTTNR